MARKHALHVAIEDRTALVRSKRSDRCSGRAADARKRCKRCRITRKHATLIAYDRIGGSMQMMRAPVIAESTPNREHVIERCCGKTCDGGKRCDETGVVRQHRRNLRLLQHDLGQPDPVGIAVLLPWQVVPSVNALPLG